MDALVGAMTRSRISTDLRVTLSILQAVELQGRYIRSRLHICLTLEVMEPLKLTLTVSPPPAHTAKAGAENLHAFSPEEQE